MKSSDSITALATALAKAQGQIKIAIKDAENPFYKSRYADLASVWAACREPLTTNGLSIVQLPMDAGSDAVGLETVLLHESGEYITSIVSAPLMKSDPQGVGSALTYLRRYGLSAMVGIVADADDDGNAASQGNGSARQRGAQKSTASQKPNATEITQIKEALVNTCKLLNSAGDKPTWGAKRLDEFAIKEYGAKADDLEIEPLRELLKKLSLKYDEIKKKPAGDPTEVERQAMIAKIKSRHPEVAIKAELKATREGAELESLSLDQLIQFETEIVPF